MIHKNVSTIRQNALASRQNVSKIKILNDDFNRDTIEEFRRDPEIAIMYLESEIEEYHKTGDIKYLLRTLKRIIKAFGITNFSKKNNINRSTLNNVFNNKHKPGINTLNSILKPLGYEALTIFRRI